MVRIIVRLLSTQTFYIAADTKYAANILGFEEEFAKFGQPDCYFHSLAKELLPKRAYMATFLTDLGMAPTIPEGGYIMLANWKALEKSVNLEKETDRYKDYKFTKWMTKNIGVQGIPPSAFYSNEHKHLGEDNVRYCFIKEDENLRKAAETLQKWKLSRTK